MNCLLFAILYRKRFGGKIYLRREPYWKHPPGKWPEPFGHWVIRTKNYDIMYGSPTPLPILNQLWYNGKMIKKRRTEFKPILCKVCNTKATCNMTWGIPERDRPYNCVNFCKRCMNSLWEKIKPAVASNVMALWMTEPKRED